MATKKPKIPITAPTPSKDTKPIPKAGVKPKIPITAPKPDPDVKAKKTIIAPKPDPDAKPKKPITAPKPNPDAKPGNESGKSGTAAGKTGPKSGPKSSPKSGPKSSGADMKKGKPSPQQQRGKRQGEMHGKARVRTKRRPVCRDALVNRCTFGSKCRFFHPNEDGGNRGVTWFTFCTDYRMGHCNRSNCSYFHISRHDEDLYRNTGEISPVLVQEAMNKAVKGNLTLIGTTPCCKNFLRGACNVPDCSYRHINRQEYEFEVFNALRDELDYVTGGPPHFPGQPGPFEHHMEPFEPMPAPGPPMPIYHEDMMPLEDMQGGHRQYDDFEPQHKRPRFHPDGLDFPLDDRDVGLVGGGWDERDRLDPAIEELRQEIANLRNENIDMRREAEAKIADLQVDLNRATAENSRLQSDIMEKHTAIKALTATNTTLVEDRKRAQEAVHQLEQSNAEMRRALDMSFKSVNVEQGKVDVLHKELTAVKNSLANSDALIKKTGDENRRLTAELVEARKKIQELHASSQLGFVNRDVPRDPRWPEAQAPGGGAGQADYGDRDRSDPEWNRQEGSPWEHHKLPDGGGQWDRREQHDRGQWSQRNSQPDKESWNQRYQPDKEPWNKRTPPEKSPWGRQNERDRDQQSTWNQRGNNSHDRDRDRERDRSRNRNDTWENNLRTVDVLSPGRPAPNNQPPGVYNNIWKERMESSEFARWNPNPREADTSRKPQQQRR